MHHAFVAMEDSRRLVVRPGKRQMLPPTNCSLIRSYCEDGSVALYSCQSRNTWIVRGSDECLMAAFRAVGLLSVSVGGCIAAGLTMITNKAEYVRYGNYNDPFTPCMQFTAFSHPVVNIDGTRAYHLWTHNTSYTDTTAYQTVVIPSAACTPGAVSGPIVYGLQDRQLFECDTRDDHTVGLNHSTDPRCIMRVIGDYIYMHEWQFERASIDVTVYDLRAHAAYHTDPMPLVECTPHFYI